MSPIDEAVIRRKLGIIIDNLQALQPIQKMTREEYASDLYRRKATERLLQEIIEAAIDINTHLIVQTGHTAPDDYFDSFIKAGELRIIASDLAEKMAPSAGLRNRLVHQYDQIVNAVVHQAVQTASAQYSEYIGQVEEYLEKRREEK